MHYRLCWWGSSCTVTGRAVLSARVRGHRGVDCCCMVTAMPVRERTLEAEAQMLINSGDEALAVDSSTHTHASTYDETCTTTNHLTSQPRFLHTLKEGSTHHSSLACWWRNYPAATEALWIPRGPSYHASFVIKQYVVGEREGQEAEKRGDFSACGLLPCDR